MWYFLSKWSMCSRALRRRDAMLVFLGSPSSLRAIPPNKFWIAVLTLEDDVPENVCDVRNCAYGTFWFVVGVVICAWGGGLMLLVERCDVIQGSNGRTAFGVRLDIDIVDSGKLSESLKPAFSSFSWRRHFARLFWNHTCKHNVGFDILGNRIYIHFICGSY